MSDKDKNDHRLLTNKQQIVSWYQTQGGDKQLVGLEYEKLGIESANGQTASYTGKNSYLAILGKIYEELGWEITAQKDYFILQLQRNGAVLDLESDGRIELAGSPHESIHDLAREFRIHQSEIAEISKIFGISWLGIGYHPVSKNECIEDLPLERKKLMKEFFTHVKDSTGNDFGLAWYKKTAGIHANVDFIDEADMVAKSKSLLRLMPILTAMFANSPFSKGEFSGYLSFRSQVALASNIKHLEIPRALFDHFEGAEDWVNYVCELPVLFLKKGDEWIRPQMSFNEFIEKGYEGHMATMDDFFGHLQTVWMPLRIRNTIELRCFDALPPSLTPSVAALMKGLVYHKDFAAKAHEMTGHWSYEQYVELCQDVSKNALYASIDGRKVLDLAKELITFAEETLVENSIRNFEQQDESIYLEPIKHFVFVKEKSPARWLLEEWENSWAQNLLPVFEWAKY